MISGGFLLRLIPRSRLSQRSAVACLLVAMHSNLPDKKVPQALPSSGPYTTSLPACLLRRKRVPFEENMQTALQAMDVALKQTVSLRDETKVFARAIFWRDETKTRPLGDGAEVGPSSGANWRSCSS